jgi:hypothetical protein
MKLLRPWSGCAATLALALSAPAHPGHGLSEQGALHLVTSPDHLAILALGGGVLWLGARFVHRRVPRRLLLAGVLLGVRA